MRPAWSALGVLAAGLLLAAVPARAQDSTNVWTSPRVKGAHSMQFTINQNFTLSSFEGASFSLQRQVTKRSANRFGLSFELHVGDNGQLSSASDTASSVSQSSDNDFGGGSVELSAHRIVYSDPARRMSFYGGLGPFASYRRAHDHSRNQGPAGPASYDYVQSRTLNEWAVGLDGLLGVDWAIGSHLALLAEYSTQLSYSSGHQDLELHQTSPVESFHEATSEHKSTTFSSGGVHFGISAYY
jgi:opacity protein-like surface antigen